MTQWTNIRIQLRTRDKLNLLETGMSAKNMDEVVSALIECYEEEHDLDLGQTLTEIDPEQHEMTDFSRDD